ncbi:hypothetical protein ColLi_11440 [Colletotrichum liriopes]|uniref:Uncharacterized protein n=1 Tax=Colletotrichum liriopes TaxID=708192 RepID=A0AA37LXR8_9PEZI|nr:hypothetical protein ColLi_11440 [Colletotrichum liriopes]
MSRTSKSSRQDRPSYLFRGVLLGSPIHPQPGQKSPLLKCRHKDKLVIHCFLAKHRLDARPVNVPSLRELAIVLHVNVASLSDPEWYAIEAKMGSSLVYRLSLLISDPCRLQNTFDFVAERPVWSCTHPSAAIFQLSPIGVVHPVSGTGDAAAANLPPAPYSSPPRCSLDVLTARSTTSPAETDTDGDANADVLPPYPTARHRPAQRPQRPQSPSLHAYYDAMPRRNPHRVFDILPRGM